MSAVEVAVDAVADVIRGYQFRYTSEEALQDGIEEALELAGLKSEREVRLSRGERLDFLVGGVAIEVKVNGDRRPLEAQLARYCRLDEVDGVVVVTTRVRHLGLPRVLEGKPVVVVGLAGSVL